MSGLTSKLDPDSGSSRTLEIAHVLFTDIVSYSKLPMDEQEQLLMQLQAAVRNTSEFARAEANEQLIRLPTGDGMALVFFQDPVAPVRCALELSRILRDFPGIKLRMGIHSGPVYRVADINASFYRETPILAEKIDWAIEISGIWRAWADVRRALRPWISGSKMEYV